MIPPRQPLCFGEVGGCGIEDDAGTIECSELGMPNHSDQNQFASTRQDHYGRGSSGCAATGLLAFDDVITSAFNGYG